MNHPPQSLQMLQRRSDNGYMGAIEADLMPTLTALKLDTVRTTYIGRKGDLSVWLTEIPVGQRKKEPAMLLANRRDPVNKNSFVLLGNLWRLVDPTTLEETRIQTEDIALMAEQLFGFVTKDDAYRVLDAIYDFAEDLKNAKPPQWMTHGQWLAALAEDDMKFMVNGQVVNG